jgi:hypothetical protein
MITTRLIQRLKKPIESKENPLIFVSNRLSFGGGLVNGGLSNDAMKLLNPIFRFDYMGSSEFEWGAVPQTLARILEYSKKGILKKSEAVFGEIKLKKEVYYLCKKEDEEKVIQRITSLANKGDYDDKDIFLKEPSCLKVNLEKDPKDIYHETYGWIELDNDFMFFIDKGMFDKILILFGLKKEKK